MEAGFTYENGRMENYISRPINPLLDYPVMDVNNLFDGLMHYLVGGGGPAVIGPNLAKDLQYWQKRNNWPKTSVPCDMVQFRDYGSWDKKLASLNASLTLGQLRYTDDGSTTTVSDYYSFPLDEHNWPLYFLSLGNHLGTPYPVTGAWPTPR